MSMVYDFGVLGNFVHKNSTENFDEIYIFYDYLLLKSYKFDQLFLGGIFMDKTRRYLQIIYYWKN